MKKLFSKLAVLAIAVFMCFSFAGCNILTIYVPTDGNGENGNPGTSSTVTKPNVTDGMKTETYGKTYKVSSVDFNFATKKGAETDKITATKKVYDSVVNVKAGMSSGSQLGSGTIIDLDVTYEDATLNNKPFLYILTCHHVINGSSDIVVYIPRDNTQTQEKGDYSYYDLGFGATIMGSDKDTDISILRIEINDEYKEKFGFGVSNYSEKIVKAQVANYELTRGEDMFAIGCPTGSLPGTVSYGNVSNLYVEVNVSDVGEMILHQTDAATNKGNSGGGIFNFAGQLIGVLNAGDPDYDGISFFIPITGGEGVEKIANQLVTSVTNENYGYIEGRWKLGASFVSTEAGIYVTSIIKGSAIGNSEIQDKDYIFGVYYGDKSCSMKSLSEFDTFYKQMQKDLKIGDTVSIKHGYFDRGGFPRTMTTTVTLTQYIYSPTNG